MLIKNIDDQRALTDMGSALFVQKASGKYSLFLPVTDLPATGAAPDQQETTTTTSRRKTYTPSRQDTPQKEFTFFPHRDNYMILEEYYNKTASFLQIKEDGTAWAFQGKVSYYDDAVSTNSVSTAKLVITTSSAGETPILNVYDLIEDTVTITNAIDTVIELDAGGSQIINVSTDPAVATIAAESDTTAVATVLASEHKVTITAVKAGSAIVKIKATKTGNADGFTTILVIVKAASE